MVHQHFMLIPVFTVTENIILGDEPTEGLGWLLDRRDGAQARRREISERYGLAVAPDAIVEELPVGVQQRVEILKALYREARDPDPGRADRRAHAAGDRGALRRSCASCRDAGKAHHLHHPQAEGGPRDRRPDHGAAAGKVVGTRDPGPRPTRTLAAMMVGRAVQLDRRQDAGPARRAGARGARTSTVLDDRGHVAVDGVSLEVRAGEIVRRRRRAGQRPDRARGGDDRPAPPRPRARSGSRATTSPKADAAHVLDAGRRPRPGGPSARRPGRRLLDRRQPGARTRYDKPPFARGLRPQRSTACAEAAERARTRTSTSARRRSLRRRRTLSGGNQQKVDRGPRVLAPDQPADRQPADARPRRRARSSTSTRASSQKRDERRGRADRVRRARRGHRARPTGSRDVPRPHRRRRARPRRRRASGIGLLMAGVHDPRRGGRREWLRRRSARRGADTARERADRPATGGAPTTPSAPRRPTHATVSDPLVIPLLAVVARARHRRRS